MTTAPRSPDATLVVDGLPFRDLDHDGVLAPYEDWRLGVEVRTADLLARMTVQEKVGLVLHGTAPATGGPLASIGVGDGYDLAGIEDLVLRRHVVSMISRLDLAPAVLAEQNNAIQRVAASGRLGIPVMISSDPRNHRSATLGAGVSAAGFSVWPGPLGLAALGDVRTVRRFGAVVRREYRAVGFHMALSPQADLATSPRWPRIDGTFGEDPVVVRACVGAYVAGVQGGPDGLAADGVAAVVKHWVGYGASHDGFDGHNHYGRFSSFPGGAFDAHVDAFRDAFARGVAGVMPTYNILLGVEIGGERVEEVGAGYSRTLLNGLLRTTHGFDGLVLSDWGITRDMNESARTGVPPQGPAQIAMPWGVERLTKAEKFAAGLAAGIDQFGGEDEPGPLLDALARGLVDERRIDDAARRVLTLMFRLGLFDAPFVDAAAAPSVLADPAVHVAAADARRRSIVALEAPTEPLLAAGSAVHVVGLDPGVFAAAGLRVVDQPEGCDVAVVHLAAPYELLHPGFFFGARQHEGSLEFAGDHPGLAELRRVAAVAPVTVVVVHLDRPAVLTTVRSFAHALLVEFGVDAAAVVEALTGTRPPGRLPFQLPGSMDAVLARRHDRPRDDPAPLYDVGYRAG